jgi:C4-dicarboxylate transporter, DctM subunit
MTELGFAALIVSALTIFVLLGVHIAVALIGIGFAGIWFIREDVGMAMRLLYLSAYNGVADYIFATIPLFVLMGLLVSISNVGRDTFLVAETLLHRLRGGLGVATVAANTVFAAVTGVSIASAAVFTRVAVPEMVRHGYRTAFAAGTVAGSSVLGMMIPPSLLMIIYGVLAEQSIGTLFIAGVIPGFLLAGVFVAMIVLMATLSPGKVFDVRQRQALALQRTTQPLLTGAQMAGKIVPIATLVVLVLGGLYTGFFTPTEAGGIGAFGALLVALARRSLGQGRLWQTLHETGSVSVTILILLIVLFLGMILDSSSILLIMTPVAVPIAADLGFNLIQFGVITVLAVEIGLLTPPFGISVFTVKSTLNDPKVSVESIFGGVLPFLGAMLFVLLLVALFPALSLALV